MPWEFLKRSDGKIAVTLDNNVWDFLCLRNIDLATELPRDRFALYITREVEIETLAIPNDETKIALKDFIARTIEACSIETTRIFGFAHEGPGPQRHGGFGLGVWQSRTQSEYYAAIQEQFLTSRPLKNSELSGNEGDAAVGAQSFTSIVLTCERPNKKGPLRFARENGGAVLYLPSFEGSGLTLKAFVEHLFQSI